MKNYIIKTRIDEFISSSMLLINWLILLLLLLVTVHYVVIKKKNVLVFVQSFEKLQFLAFLVYLGGELPFTLREFVDFFHVKRFLNGPYWIT